MSRRDDVAATLAGWVYSRIATKEAQARLLRVLRTGDPEERAPLSSVIRTAPKETP